METKVDLGYNLKDLLSMQFRSSGFTVDCCICYKDVPLWRSTPDMDWDTTEVWLSSGYEDEPYVLILQDPYGDLYTYGMWDTLEEALAWLKNPKPLY